MNTAGEKQLIDGMPDLVIAVTRDGRLLSFGGGRGIPHLVPHLESVGQALSVLWPGSLAAGIQHLVRKALTTRRPMDAELTDGEFTYQVRTTPQGPDRALCVLRARERPVVNDASLSDRRGFLRRFEATVAFNVLTEKPLALVTLLLDGVDDIARLDARLAVRVVTAALDRLLQEMTVEQSAACTCTGQLTEDQIAFVLQTNERRTIDTLIAQVQDSISTPLVLDHTTVTLRCFAGVALLGRDATSTKGLLESARFAAHEAHRASAAKPRYFSDTIKMKALARVDVARELRDAIASHAIQARYVGRHDLATGRLVARVAYASWPHALRGAIAAKQFIAIADATGTALALSRAILAAIARTADGQARISYGPLRQHLLHEDFLGDIQQFLGLGHIPAERFEVRIPEAIFVALPAQLCAALQSFGIQIVVDEVARGLSSLDRTARAPLWGLQLDRAWVTQVRSDAVARRICRASIAMATALDITAIATGIDDEAQRLAVLDLGCRFGSGDLYAANGAR